MKRMVGVCETVAVPGRSLVRAATLGCAGCSTTQGEDETKLPVLGNTTDHHRIYFLF